MKRIPLTQGKEALVDDEDYEAVSAFKWFATQSRPGSLWYAARWVYQDGERIRIWLHRELMNLPDDLDVDHIDRDGLNNQRNNLRPATTFQSAANKSIRSDNTTGYRGVYAHRNGRFYVYVQHNHDKRYVGAFATAIEAAHAWDAVAKELFGEFAALNFPEG